MARKPKIFFMCHIAWVSIFAFERDGHVLVVGKSAIGLPFLESSDKMKPESLEETLRREFSTRIAVQSLGPFERFEPDSSRDPNVEIFRFTNPKVVPIGAHIMWWDPRFDVFYDSTFHDYLRIMESRNVSVRACA